MTHEEYFDKRKTYDINFAISMALCWASYVLILGLAAKWSPWVKQLLNYRNELAPFIVFGGLGVITLGAFVIYLVRNHRLTRNYYNKNSSA